MVLLLFTVSFTIFLEIEFDFIFYVRYRSEEISPYAIWEYDYALSKRQDLPGRHAKSVHNINPNPLFTSEICKKSV